MLFAMAPDIFHGVQFGGVGGKIFQFNGAALIGHEVAHQSAAMSGQAVPNNDQPFWNMSAQVAQELDDLRPFDAAGKQLKVEVPDRQPGDGREAFPVETVLQDRRLAFGRPGAHAMRAFAQSAFVDKDDGAAFLPGLFFNAGQRFFFQCAMADSSRWMARPTGRWQLHPKARKMRQTWPGWNFSPVCRWIKSATRQEVHRLVPYPNASGPSLSPRRKFSSWADCKRGLRPARPACFNSGLPPRFQASLQRRADSRETPVWRATSAWLSPLANNLAARKRRSSRAAKSRFTPLGLPMPENIPEGPRLVTILCGTQ